MPDLQKRQFDSLPDGRRVDEYVLSNREGIRVSILTYGGIIRSLSVPDRQSKYADIVLGFGCIEDYLRPHPYFGAIVGRVAGRIGRGDFEVGGQCLQLSRNEGNNHLHGGFRGLDKRLWLGESRLHHKGTPSVRLHTTSCAGEEGYPGNLEVSVTYSLTPDDRLILETHATCDAATPFSPTQHTYFNLAGEGSGTVEDHELQIFASSYAKVDPDFVPVPKRIAVVAHNDLRDRSLLSAVIPKLNQQHGDLYFLDRPEESELFKAARLVHPESGRQLDVSTTESCMQFYTGSMLNGTCIGKSSRSYPRFAGLCLECHGFPGGASAEVGNTILRPGFVFSSTTVYQFSALSGG